MIYSTRDFYILLFLSLHSPGRTSVKDEDKEHTPMKDQPGRQESQPVQNPPRLRLPMKSPLKPSTPSASMSSLKPGSHDGDTASTTAASVPVASGERWGSGGAARPMAVTPPRGNADDESSTTLAAAGSAKKRVGKTAPCRVCGLNSKTCQGHVKSAGIISGMPRVS